MSDDERAASDELGFFKDARLTQKERARNHCNDHQQPAKRLLASFSDSSTIRSGCFDGDRERRFLPLLLIDDANDFLPYNSCNVCFGSHQLDSIASLFMIFFFFFLFPPRLFWDPHLRSVDPHLAESGAVPLHAEMPQSHACHLTDARRKSARRQNARHLLQPPRFALAKSFATAPSPLRPAMCKSGWRRRRARAPEKKRTKTRRCWNVARCPTRATSCARNRPP